MRFIPHEFLGPHDLQIGLLTHIFSTNNGVLRWKRNNRTRDVHKQNKIDV